MSFKNCCLIGILLFQVGCASNRSSEHEVDVKPVQVVMVPINHGLFTVTNDAFVQEDALFTLSEEQKASFLADFHTRTSRGVRPHEALSEFLENRLDSFTFYGATLLAEEAWGQNKGNCMSLAILTTALAKLVDLDFDYREVNSIPVFEKNNDLLLSSSHVQTRVFAPLVDDPEVRLLYRSNVVIDYFPVNTNHTNMTVDFNTFLAMYYRNKAADALLVNDINRAFSYIMQGFEKSPNDVGVINMLAVLHRRAGDYETAEKIYQTGLKINPNSLSLLSNYIVLSEHKENSDLVSELRDRMLDLDDPNPYIWLEQAYSAEQRGDRRRAKKMFEKTLRIAPYVQPAYVGLYRMFLAEGEHEKAEAMLKAALQWSYEMEERKIYKFKLNNLQSS